MTVSKLDDLGELTTNFLLNDMSLYVINTTATGGYASTDWKLVGYTSPEKEIDPKTEKYKREDKIPRVLTYIKTIRKGLSIKCGLSNQTPSIDALINQGTKTSLGATGTRIAVGITEAAKEYRAVRFVATLDSGVNFALTIPKCDISQDGAQKIGGESETVTPLVFEAMYNPAVSGTASLYYKNYWAAGISVTADVPPGYR
jgi:hypothetical protein